MKGNGNGKKPVHKPVPISPKGGARLIPGNPGNTGGKAGRSGRKPEVYTELCRDLISNPKTQASVKKILSDAKHPHFAAVYKHIAEHAYGKPTQPIGNPDSGEVVIRVIREESRVSTY